MAPVLAGAFPHFRGASYLGTVEDPALEMKTDWRRDPPREIWSVPMGEGYAGAVILDGRVFVLDHDARGHRDVLRCLSLADGREIWSYAYPAKIKRNHGMSRASPSVDSRFVVAVGPLGHVTCLEPATGKLLWTMDLAARYSARIPAWYSGQSPLIDGDRVVLGVGGRALLVAVEGTTGRVLWETPNPHAWQMTHSSVIPVAAGGVRALVYCSAGGIVAVDPGTGRRHWEYPGWRVPFADVPSPVPVAPDRVFFTAGYGAGSLMLQVAGGPGQPTVRRAWALPGATFGAHVHTPVLHQGHLYGVDQDRQLCCLDTRGRVLWRSGMDHRFGLAPHLVINGRLLAMSEEGVLHLVRAGPAGYQEQASLKVLPGKDPMGTMAYASGRLIVRDFDVMKCLDLRKK